MHFLILQPQDRYKSRTVIAAPGLPDLKYIDFVVSHSMYDMKRAVHKISLTELINNIFFCFSPSVFIPHPQGRKLSMVLYAAVGLYFKTAQALLCHIPCVVI